MEYVMSIYKSLKEMNQKQVMVGVKSTVASKRNMKTL